MKFKEISPYNSDGSIRQLKDLVVSISENDYTWSILEFDGVGMAPNKMEMAAFEALALAEPQGFFMTWTEFKSFVKSVNDVTNCLIVGALLPDDISTKKNDIQNYINCEVVIEVLDGADWTIGVNGKHINFLSRFE